MIPIVLYTGGKKWKASLSFSEVQEKLEGYQEKDKSYTIVDINNYTEKELLEDDLTISKVLVLEKTRTNENFSDSIEKVIQKTKKEKQYMIEKIIDLILRKQLGEEATESLLEKFRNEEEEGMLLVAERLKKDTERKMKRCKMEGKKEGKEERIEETKRMTAKKMLEEGLSMELIEKITGLGKQKIEELG